MNIHPTAVVHPGANLDPTVSVGPGAVIGNQVAIGPATVVGAHAVIYGPAMIGARNQIYPGAAIGLEPQDLKYDGAPSGVRIGDDNCIREYVTINRATHATEETIIGNSNLLMAYTHIGHNCVISDQVVITNGVQLAGHVRVESQARIGGLVGVHQFVQVGRLAMVGGMARIDRDVPPFMLVEGNPSRVRSLNLVGLRRAGLSSSHAGQVFLALKKAFRLLYRSNLHLSEALDQLGQLGEHEVLEHLQSFCRDSMLPGRRGLTPGRRGRDLED